MFIYYNVKSNIKLVKADLIIFNLIMNQSSPEMSAGRAKPESRLGTDRLFCVSDRVRVIIVVTQTDFQSSSSYNS